MSFSEWQQNVCESQLLCSISVVNLIFSTPKKISGLWAREFGRLTNLDIPLAIVEHQYARIGPLPAVNQSFFQEIRDLFRK